MVISRFLGSLFGDSRDVGNATPQPDRGAPATPLDDDARLAAALDRLLDVTRSSGGMLPGLISSQLRQLDDLIRSMVEYIAHSGASTEQRVLLEALITDYIGTPLATYLRTGDADRHEDSHATSMFAKQLGVLHPVAQDLNNQVRSGAITELSTHSRFLEDKFTAGPLSLYRDDS